MKIVETNDGRWYFEQHLSPLRRSLPDDSAFSRFLTSLLELLAHHDYVEDMFYVMRDQLKELLPDYAVHLAADGKKIESHSTGYKMKRTGVPSDPDADWGRYEKNRYNKDGSSWRQVTQWFGYKIHAMVDTVYELLVAYEVTRAE